MVKDRFILSMIHCYLRLLDWRGTVLKQQSCLAIIDSMEFVESNPLFQNPKSMSYFVLLLQLGVGLAFGGLICKDKSGCVGNSS